VSEFLTALLLLGSGFTIGLVVAILVMVAGDKKEEDGRE